MKYILFFLFISTILVSTLCFLGIGTSSKPSIHRCEHGKASKITFDGHSYIVWQQNMSDCIVHDPDCPCEKKKAEERKELMDYLQHCDCVLFGIECELKDLLEKRENL